MNRWPVVITATCLIPLGSATAVSPRQTIDPPPALAPEHEADKRSHKRGKPIIMVCYRYDVERYAGIQEKLFRASLSDTVEQVNSRFPHATGAAADSEKAENDRLQQIKRSVDFSGEREGPSRHVLLDGKVLESLEGELTPKDKPADYKNYDVCVGVCDLDGSRMRFVDIRGVVRDGDKTWKMSHGDFVRFRRLLDREMPEDIDQGKK